MALTKIDTTVANVTDLSVSLTLDATPAGIRTYVDTELSGKSDVGHNHDANYVKLSGSTMTGALTLPSSNPTQDFHATPKKYVDDQISALSSTTLTITTGDGRYVKLAGSTMTGRLTLSADPTNNLHAATKQYVDNNAGGLGYGQTYTAPTRSPNFVYQNTTGKPIFINITSGLTGDFTWTYGATFYANASSSGLIVNANVIASTESGNRTSNISAIIPAGWYYTYYTSDQIFSWKELR